MILSICIILIGVILGVAVVLSDWERKMVQEQQKRIDENFKKLQVLIDNAITEKKKADILKMLDDAEI